MTYREAKEAAKKAAVDLLFAAIVDFEKSEVLNGQRISEALAAAKDEKVTLADIEAKLRGNRG